MIAETKSIESRAQTLAELGLVTREDGRFRVTVPDCGGTEYEVWRGDDGGIRCTCAEFRGACDPAVRCEHMLAVRFAIKSRNSELTPGRTRRTARSNVVDFGAGRTKRQIRGDSGAGESANAVFETEALDRLDKTWSHSIKELRQIGNFFAVTATVTVNGITREGIGTGVAADPRGIETAERLALKHAIFKFAADAADARQSIELPVRVYPSNPIARSLFDLVTAKQLGMIRAMARELGIKPDAECDRLMNCRTDELSKRAASSFIEHLQELQKSNPAAAAVLRRAG